MQTFLDHAAALFTLFTLRCVVPLLITLGFSLLLKRFAERSSPK